MPSIKALLKLGAAKVIGAASEVKSKATEALVSKKRTPSLRNFNLTADKTDEEVKQELLFTPMIYEVVSSKSSESKVKSAEVKSELKTSAEGSDAVEINVEVKEEVKAEVKVEVKAEVKAEVKEAPAPKKIIRRAVIGCAGSGPGPKSKQMLVAELMNRIIAAAKQKPDCIIILGDNFYPHGVDDEFAEEFRTHFYEIYRNSKLTALKNIPAFLILGNHCVNLSMMGGREGQWDQERAYAQVAHTYSHCESTNTNAEPNMYLEEKLILEDLPKWNMPRASYALVNKGDKEKGEGALLEFFINWNTIVRDFIKFREDGGKNPNNQMKFIKEQYEKYKAIYGADRLVTYVYSHGPRSVHDKGLSDLPDVKLNLYINPEEVRILRETFKIQGNYNEIFGQIFDYLDIKVDVTYAADTHAMYNYFGKAAHPNPDLKKPPIKVCQVGAGAGGNPDLEPNQDLDHPDSLRYLEDWGFVISEVDLSDPSKKVTNDFFTRRGLHMRFDQLHAEPIMEETKDERVVALREIIVDAYKKYFAQRKLDKKSSSPGGQGVKDADDLYNEFHQYKELKFAAAVKILRHFFDRKRFSRLRDNSLFWFIEREIEARSGADTFEKFFAKAKTKAFSFFASKKPSHTQESVKQRHATAGVELPSVDHFELPQDGKEFETHAHADLPIRVASLSTP